MRFVKANGGPLALVFIGLGLAGVTTGYGWILVGGGFVWWLADFLVPRLPWEIRRKPSVPGQPDAHVTRQRWQPRTTVLENNGGLMVDLQNHFRPEVTGALACDVRAPIGPPARLTFAPGLRDRVYATYPEQWGVAVNGLIPGTYHITWYEADDNWKWTEFAREEIEVARLESPRAFQ